MMRGIGVRLWALAFCLIPAGCDLEEVLADSARFREHFNYTYPLKSGGALTLENFNGAVEILAWEKEEVRITGVKYARTEQDLRELRIEVAAAPDSVRIRTLRPAQRTRGMGARYVLRVPREVELQRIATSNGSIRVEDVRGSSRLETSNGAITLRRIQGRTESRTSNGSITADVLAGDAVLRTSNGGIRLDRLEGALDAATSNGGISVRIAEPARGQPVRLETSNGAIELTMDAWEDNEVRALTSNGPITVRLPASVKARLRAETSNASIHSDFELLTRSSTKNLLQGDIGGRGPLIQLATSNGAIRVLRM